MYRVVGGVSEAGGSPGAVFTVVFTKKEHGQFPERGEVKRFGGCAFFQRAIQNWRGAVNYFVVTLTPEDIRTRVQQKLAWLPAEERVYWRGVLAKTAADSAPLNFLAISLDSAGKPISVVNTDPATGLFLRDGADVSANAVAAVRRDVSAIMRAYPVGLFVDSLGALVANDAYAPPSVWEAFRRDNSG